MLTREQQAQNLQKEWAESPRWRANHDMASVAISLVRQHDQARSETSEKEARWSAS